MPRWFPPPRGTESPRRVYDVQVDASADDVAVVRAAREGDREAFGVLVERYQEVAFRAAYLVVRDAGLAEDVAQEGFVRAYQNLGRFDPHRVEGGSHSGPGCCAS